MVAMEQEELLEENTNDGASDGVNDMPSVDNVDNAMLETNEVADTVEETAAQIEEATEGAEDLEKLGDAVAGTVEEGGMTPATAEVVDVAVESICKRLGISRKVVPAFESFGSKSTRLQSTKVAMEGIAETARSIWDAIMRAIKKAYDYVVEFFKKIFDVSLKLKNRAEALIKSFEKLKGSASAKDLDLGSLAQKTSIGGKVIDGAGYAGAAKSVAAKVKASTGDAENLLRVQQTVAEYFGKSTKELDKILAESKKVKEAQKSRGDVVGPAQGFANIEGSTITRGEEWLGNRTLIMVTPNEGAEDLSVAEKMKLLWGAGISVGDFNPRQTEVTETTVTYPQPTQIIAGLKEIIEISKDLDGAKKVIDALSKVKGAVDKEVKLFMSTKDGAEKGEHEAIQSFKAFATKAIPSTSKFISASNSLAVSCAKDLLDYADKAHYGFKNKAEKAAA